MRARVGRKQGVLWSRYDKMQIDPVTIWTSGESTVANVSEADRQLLADYLDSSLRNSLGQSYQLVDRPGPNTLRLNACDYWSERLRTRLAELRQGS